MSEVMKDCTHCGSKNTLVKQLARTARVVRSHSNSNAKPGDLVKRYIEDVKEEVKNEKKRLKTQEYKK
jgi:predicted transcriptional regulator